VYRRAVGASVFCAALLLATFSAPPQRADAATACFNTGGTTVCIDNATRPDQGIRMSGTPITSSFRDGAPGYYQFTGSGGGIFEFLKPTSSLTIQATAGFTIVVQAGLSLPGVNVVISAPVFKMDPGSSLDLGSGALTVMAGDGSGAPGSTSSPLIELRDATINAGNIDLESNVNLTIFPGTAASIAVTTASSPRLSLFGASGIQSSGNVNLATSSLVFVQINAFASGPGSPDHDVVLANTTTTSTVVSHISGTSSVNAAGDVSITAANTVVVNATTDASNAAAGAAVARGIVTTTTRAFSDTTGVISAHAVNIFADSDATVVNTAKSSTSGARRNDTDVQAATAKLAKTSAGSMPVASALAANQRTSTTEAYASAGTLKASSAPGVTVHAASKESVTATADASPIAGSTTGVGGAVATNLGTLTTSSWMQGATVDAPKVTIEALAPRSSLSSFTASAIAGNGVNAAAPALTGAIGVNAIKQTTTAEIPAGATVGLNGDLAITARSGNTHRAVAQPSTSGPIAIGLDGATTLDIVDDTTTAQVGDGAVLNRFGGNLAITATDTSDAASDAKTQGTAGVGTKVPNTSTMVSNVTTAARLGTGARLSLPSVILLARQNAKANSSALGDIGGTANAKTTSMALSLGTQHVSAPVLRSVTAPTMSIQALGTSEAVSTSRATPAGGAPVLITPLVENEQAFANGIATANGMRTGRTPDVFVSNWPQALATVGAAALNGVDADARAGFADGLAIATSDLTLTAHQGPTAKGVADATLALGGGGAVAVSANNAVARSLLLLPANTTITAPPFVGEALNSNGTFRAEATGTPGDSKAFQVFRIDTQARWYGPSFLSYDRSVLGDANYTLVTEAHSPDPSAAMSILFETKLATPDFVSDPHATLVARYPQSYTVKANGWPHPMLVLSGPALPTGFTFTDNHDGTATLGGTAARGTGGEYGPYLIVASNGEGPDDHQMFTLTVLEQPEITSPAPGPFTVHSPGTYTTLVPYGYPLPIVSVVGLMPTGLTFVDGLDRTARLAGTPAHDTGGNYPLTIVAHNGVHHPVTGALLDDLQPFTLRVLRIPTALSLSSSVNPSVFGQPVTFIATLTTVDPDAGARVGTVTFVIDGTSHSVALVNDQASFTTSSLSVGTHNVTTTFTSGDRTYDDSAAPAASQVVNRADSLTTVTTSGPSVFGQDFAATVVVSAVAPGAGMPTGSVVFSIDGVPFGPALALTSGTASIVTNALPAGTHSIAVRYQGDGNFNQSDGSAPQVVSAADTTTGVASSVDPTVFGQPVFFTATVTAVAPGAGVPEGSVQFIIDGANFDAPVVLSGGVATSSNTAALATGAHTVTATFTPVDGNFNTSNGSRSQTVRLADTTTSLAASPASSVFGQQIAITATVAAVAPGAGTPTRIVQFQVDGLDLGGPRTLASGSVTVYPSGLSAGLHTITATYRGDPGFNGSSSSGLLFNVAPADTTTAVTTTPVVFGQSASATAVVAAVAPGAGTPTGTLQFFVDGTSFGPPAALSGGSATTSLGALGVGSHSITTTYSGDAGFNASSGASTLTVARADTATAVSASPAATVFGQNVSFTPTVAAVAPGAGLPTGTVQFRVDGVDLGAPVALGGGSATSVAATALGAGAHAITATFSGDGNFNASTGTGALTVSRADTTTMIGSSIDPANFGQPVTFSATVAPVAPGAGTPTGTVQFKADGVSLGAPVALAGGVASLTTSALASATHTITGEYSGDASFNTSTGMRSQVVRNVDTTTAVAATPNPAALHDTVTLTAVVTSPSGIPGGSLRFFDGAAALGVALPLDATGQASLTTNALTVGTHAITAVYSPAPPFNGSTSAVLSVVVQSATQLITDLETYIRTNHLAPGQSLIEKLEDARAALSHGRLESGCAQLESFVREVRAQSGKKLTVAQAAYLIAAAQRIELAAGCPPAGGDDGDGQHGDKDSTALAATASSP